MKLDKVSAGQLWQGSGPQLNEEAGYKRAHPGRKQCLIYHVSHISQYGCITKIRE